MSDCNHNSQVYLEEVINRKNERIAELESREIGYIQSLRELEAENAKLRQLLEAESASNHRLTARELELEATIATQQARIEFLQVALLEAADEIECWGAYADVYFQEKHDLEGWVAKFKAIAKGGGE
jgi:chromosome segregation ATPase